MSWKCLVALSLFGALLLFLFGWATASAALAAAPVVPSVSQAQCQEIETVLASLLQCRINHEQAPGQAGTCGDVPGPSCKPNEPARPEGRVASCPAVAACPTPPPPPTSPPCEAPRPCCQPRAPLPCPEPAVTHTMTIYNGAQVTQQNFVLRNGSWKSVGELHHYDVFVRNCPSSPWCLQGTYGSPRQAETAACSLRAHGNLAEVRPHCG